MQMWRPISEIKQATSRYVAVASPNGIFVQERKVVMKVGRLCWAYFFELPDPPQFVQYVLNEDAYEVNEMEGTEDEK